MTIDVNPAGGGGGGAAAETLQMATLPTASISSGDFYSFRVNIPSGFTLNVYSMGVQTSSNTLPSGVSTVVRDETNGTDLYTAAQKRAVGDPLTSIGGNVDIGFRISNTSGAPQDLTATFAYQIVEE